MSERVSGSFSQMVSSIGVCCICTELYKDPRILPCVHTFCFGCLKETAEELAKDSGDEMPCPVCRKVFRIPEEGIGGLRKNFFSEKLLEIIRLSDRFESNTPCDVCLADSEMSDQEAGSATMHCIECLENMCSPCARDHKRQKPCRDHHIVALGSQIPGNKLVACNTRIACDHHEKEELRLFCRDCKKVVCVLCFIEAHQLHKCSDISAVAEEFRRVIAGNVIRLSCWMWESSMKRQQIEKQKKDFLGMVEEVEMAILERRNWLRDLADSRTEILLVQLNEIKETHLEEILNRQDEVTEHLELMDSLKIHSNEVKWNGSPVEICRAVTDLNRRTDELQHINDFQIEQKLAQLKISFTKKELEIFLQNENIIGLIMVEPQTTDVESQTNATESARARKENDTAEPDMHRQSCVTSNMHDVMCSASDQSVSFWIRIHSVFKTKNETKTVSF